MQGKRNAVTLCWLSPRQLDRVPRGFGGVCAAGRGGPAEGAVGELLHLPLRVLLEPVVVPAFRAAVAQASPTACFVRGVVLEVALGGGPAADGAGAGGVPHLGQVPEPDPGVVAAGLVPVVARSGNDGVEGDPPVWPGSGGAEPPGAVSAGRAVPAGGSEGEARPVPVSGSGAFPAALGCGPGAAVADRVAV